MSRENVEIARRGYEHFIETQDILDEIFHPDFVLDMSGFRGWPEQHIHRGVEGFRAFLADWLEPWDDCEFEVEELHDAGDQVVAIVRQRGLSKATGVPGADELGARAHVSGRENDPDGGVREPGRGPRSRRVGG